jgi:hypothetical protein
VSAGVGSTSAFDMVVATLAVKLENVGGLKLLRKKYAPELGPRAPA